MLPLWDNYFLYWLISQLSSLLFFLFSSSHHRRSTSIEILVYYEIAYYRVYLSLVTLPTQPTANISMLPAG